MAQRILIVDDEFGLADIIAELLADVGYHAEVAINGRLGLARMTERKPDLVVLDVSMPVMDGPSLLRHMRASDGLSDIPVIMMTALPESLPTERPPLYQAFLVKPFTPEALFSRIEQLLGPLA